MTRDDDNSFLVRVRRAVRSTTRRTDGHRDGLIERVRGRVEQTLAPAIEDAARKMLLKLAEPKNAQKLQETLAGMAQFAMKSGFRSDPNAGLLFEFADQLERRHSREQVLEVVVGHAMVYEQDLLAMLIEAVQSGKGVTSLGADRFDAFRDRASARLLTLLCSLASLDSDEPPPNSHHASSSDKASREAKLAYFERAPIDERFKPLARMAAGEKEAFERPDPSSKETSNDGADDESPSVFRRAMSRLTGESTGESTRKTTGERTSALARLMPSLNDPATRFLTTSYLFFMQSYLVRAMIEELPEMLAMVRELDRDVHTDDASEDIIDVDPGAR